ncbi:MAG TPA: hypothetical protein VIV60_29145, partial [Polyangiaceae bacterium]
MVLAPRLYARNRFFDLFRDPHAQYVRRRAALMRGIIRQLVGDGKHKGRIVGEQVLWDDRVLLRYELPELNFVRAVSLSPLEAGLVRYALGRARVLPPDPESQRRIELALSEMANHLPSWAG